MPRFDGTGPFGSGSSAGRGFGPCGNGHGFRGRFSAGRGAGTGMGRQFGGWGWPQTKEDHTKSLTEYRKALENELEEVRKEEKELSKSE